MKYIAIVDDDFLSNFRLDDFGLTWVVGDSQGCNRAITLKPLVQETLVTTEGRSALLPKKYIDRLIEIEKEDTFQKAIDNFMNSMRNPIELRDIEGDEK